MNQELIQHAAHLQQALRRLLAQRLLRHLAAILFPIRSRDRVQPFLHPRRDAAEARVLGVERFEGEQGPTEVAGRGAREHGVDVARDGEAFFFGDVGEDGDHFGFGWGADAHEEAAGTDGPDDAGRGVGAEDDSKIGGVLC